MSQNGIGRSTASTQNAIIIFLGLAAVPLLLALNRLRKRTHESRRRGAFKSLARPDFKLEPALFRGKVEIGNLQLCRVLLVDDSQYAGWLVLVPQHNNLTEVIDLSTEAQKVLWREVAAAMRVIRKVFKPDKINEAAIGNMVSQLHIHVAGRMRGDIAWPGVHLGAHPELPHSSAKLETIMSRVVCAFGEEEGVRLTPVDVKIEGLSSFD